MPLSTTSNVPQPKTFTDALAVVQAVFTYLLTYRLGIFEPFSMHIPVHREIIEAYLHRCQQGLREVAFGLLELELTEITHNVIYRKKSMRG